jgi:uncharacterized membrane protein (UPF0182 family)
MEPVFLAAEADAIPELRRFVVSDGVRVAMTEDLAGAITQLAGLEVMTLGPVPLGAPPLPAEDGALLTSTAWAASALDLLETAETRAREGDWQGFGDALEELRVLLQRLERGGA